jgi:hypothetical protein
MNKIEQLKLSKTFKELEFLKLDLDYKTELLSELEGNFLTSVSDYLEEHPKIKDAYEKKLEKDFKIIEEENKEFIEEIIEEEKRKEEEKQNEEVLEEDEEYISKPEKDPLLKDLYRKIVKKTHPDKVKDEEKNTWYIEATNAYDNDEIFSIYLICSKLGIEYEMRIDDMDKLITEVRSYNQQIGIIESSFPWKWGESNDEIKERIVQTYINQRLMTL